MADGRCDGLSRAGCVRSSRYADRPASGYPAALTMAATSEGIGVIIAQHAAMPGHAGARPGAPDVKHSMQAKRLMPERKRLTPECKAGM